jgi:hypothetical protein
MNAEADTLYKQVDGLDVHEADDGLIVFNQKSDRVHHLNASAGVLFELCSEPVSRRQLVEMFCTLFDLDSLSGERALESTLDQLIKESVLVEVDAS